MGIKIAAALADDSTNNILYMQDSTSSKKCQGKWQTWVEMKTEYEATLVEMQKCREKYRDSIQAKDINDWEELGGMIADCKYIIEELQKKILYEVDAIPTGEDILALLTPLQIQVVLSHEDGYRFSEIADFMNVKPPIVIKAYQQAVRKIEKYLRQRDEGLLPGLSPQQEQIYRLRRQGKKNKDIADILGTSVENVKYQLKAIKKKGSKIG